MLIAMAVAVIDLSGLLPVHHGPRSKPNVQNETMSTAVLSQVASAGATVTATATATAPT
jgi:hypothetical protein